MPDDQPRLLEELPPERRRGPRGLSVSALVSYARCPRQCYWTVIEPLPRQGSPAARLGSLVHGWIERQASGQGSLLGGDEELDEAAGSEPSRMPALKAAFLASPYAELSPRSVERPFVLAVDGQVVRGRVDAVYERDGRIEIVDFKTGRPHGDDPGAGRQLDLYALAATDCWGHPADRVRTTEWYLEAARGESRDFDAARIEAVRRRLSEDLAGLSAGRFEVSPGSFCRRCDFLGFCSAGRAHLETLS